MAGTVSQTLSQGRFPDGTVLSIFKTHDASRQPGGLAPVTTGVMAPGGVTVTGLEPDTAYIAGAVVGGVWMASGFRTRALLPGAPLDRSSQQAAAELLLTGTTSGTAQALVSIVLTAPYAGAVYDVDFTGGFFLQMTTTTKVNLILQMRLDGVDVHAATGSDTASFAVSDAPAVANEIQDTIVARSLLVTVPTEGPHALEVYAWKAQAGLTAIARKYRSLKAVCLPV